VPSLEHKSRGEGGCFFIVRLEHGLLDELVNSFMEMVEGGVVPNRSTILLGSVSHLAFIGAQSYTEHVTTETSCLAAGLGGQVSVLPLPLVAWVGCNDPCVTRGLFDFNRWLGSLPEFPQAGTAAAPTSDLIQGGVGGLQPQYDTILSATKSLSLWGKKTCKIKGPTDLSLGVGPMDIKRESIFIDRLRVDLCNKLFLNMDPMPEFSRDAERDVASPPLLIIGGSHANRLARMAAPSDRAMLGITRPGWRAGKTAVESVVEELEETKERITKDHVEVLQLVDNVAYHAMTNEDNIIPCCKDITGKYHVDGDLLLAPPELINPFL
jgi:hypothetical protein